MFVDTNVLVVARSAKAPNRQAALDALSRERRTETLRISRQVVREYLAVVTRPQTWASPLALAKRFAHLFLSVTRLTSGGSAIANKALTNTVPV